MRFKRSIRFSGKLCIGCVRCIRRAQFQVQMHPMHLIHIFGALKRRKFHPKIVFCKRRNSSVNTFIHFETIHTLPFVNTNAISVTSFPMFFFSSGKFTDCLFALFIILAVKFTNISITF